MQYVMCQFSYINFDHSPLGLGRLDLARPAVACQFCVCKADKHTYERAASTKVSSPAAPTNQRVVIQRRHQANSMHSA